MSIQYVMIRCQNVTIFEHYSVQNSSYQKQTLKYIKECNKSQQAFVVQNEKLFVSVEAIILCCIGSAQLDDVKGFSFLKDVEARFVDQFYDGNVAALLAQQQFTKGQFNTQFAGSVQKVVKEYSTIISGNDIIQSCLEKANNNKQVIAECIGKQIKSNELAKQTNENAIEMNLLGKEFETKAHRVLEKAKEANCMGCKGRLLCYSGMLIGMLFIYWAISSSVCGNMRLLKGC